MFEPEVQALLEVLKERIPAILGENLEGLYVKGSLALGDFNPQTSDIDLLVVVKQTLEEANFGRLDAMHRQIQVLPNPYANELEVAYIPAWFLNNFQPGHRFPSIERGEQMKWKPLLSNWILDFWIVRERGIVLFGSDPKTIIDPISQDQILVAARFRLADWLEYVDTWDDPNWQTHAGEMRYTVETLCRILNTLQTGGVSSKPVAVRWAMETLPEPWKALVQASQGWWRPDLHPQAIPEVGGFVRWVAENAVD